MEITDKLEFKKEIEDFVLPHSTIGVHGLNIESDEHVYDQIQSVLTKGLINNHPSGMVGNIAFYGGTDDWGYDEIFDYAYYTASSEKYLVSIIVAIPETLVTSNGDNYLVCFGDAADYRKTSGLQNYNEDALGNWLNQYLSVKHYLPKEFIAGVMIVDKITGKHIFENNPSYYGNMSLSEQTSFSDQLISDLLAAEYCNPTMMYKINGNCLMSLKKEKVNNGNNYFAPRNIIDLSDKTKAIDDLNSYIDIYSANGIDCFYLEQIKNYLERNYVK